MFFALSMLSILPLPVALSQVWVGTEDAARQALEAQEEQVRLSREYLAGTKQRYEQAKANELEKARHYRAIQDRMRAANRTLNALIAERDRTESTTRKAALDQRIMPLRTQLSADLVALEEAGTARTASLSQLSSTNAAFEQASKLTADLEQKQSAFKLQLSEYFASLAPPVLEEVAVLNDTGGTIYQGTWRPKEDELRERIALADVTLLDYDHKIATHRERLDEFIDEGIAAKDAFDAADKAYLEFFQSFDEESAWPTYLQVRRYGTGLWQTMRTDAGFRVISIFNNRNSFGGVKGAIAYETMWAAYDGYAWYNGEPRNPTWDVMFNSAETRADWYTSAEAGADKAVDSIFATPTATKIYKNKPISKAAKGALVALYNHVRPRDSVKIAELNRLYKAGELSAVFSENMVHGTSPSALLASPSRSVGSKAFTDYWKSPQAISGSVKRKLFSRSAYRGYARSLVLSALKKAVLSEIERERLNLLADVNATYDHSKWIVNRIIAERMLLTQAIEHQRELIAEREDLRRLLAKQDGERFVLDRKPNGVLNSRKPFELWLTFSGPVLVREITLDGKNIEIDQSVSGGEASKVWKGTFDLEGLSEVSRLSVDAMDPASQKGLADPRRPPRWDADRGAFEPYREKPDRNHTLKLVPIEDGTATAIVFDTSTSMADFGKIIAAKKAADRLLANMDQGRSDVFGVFTFENCLVREAQSIDGSVQKAREAIASSEARGDTPLAKAIQTATQALLEETAKSKLVLLVITDGEDTCGGQWQRELSRANDVLAEANLRVIE